MSVSVPRDDQEIGDDRSSDPSERQNASDDERHRAQLAANWPKELTHRSDVSLKARDKKITSGPAFKRPSQKVQLLAVDLDRHPSTSAVCWFAERWITIVAPLSPFPTSFHPYKARCVPNAIRSFARKFGVFTAGLIAALSKTCEQATRFFEPLNKAFHDFPLSRGIAIKVDQPVIFITLHVNRPWLELWSAKLS